MDWTARLAVRRTFSTEWPATSPTKPTKPSFVSSGGAHHGHLQNIETDALRCDNRSRVRLRLLASAGFAGIDPAVIHAMAASDVADLLALTDGSDAALRDYLHVLRDAAMRERGRVPEDETVAALCRHCGPVWMHPAVARVLPVVTGMPTAAGCAWCAPRGRGLPIPRPPITCGACRHFVPDRVNPAGGLGECGAGVARSTLPYPFAQRACGTWRPRPEATASRTGEIPCF